MIQTFENNEFKATVEYCGDDMHKVTYTGPGMKPFTNLVFNEDQDKGEKDSIDCLLYTSPSPRDISGSRMPSSA